MGVTSDGVWRRSRARSPGWRGCDGGGGGRWGVGVVAQGAWEGSLARYEPDGTFVERTPTVLFIYTDSKDDAARVAAGGVPYRLDLMLRYGEAAAGI